MLLLSASPSPFWFFILACLSFILSLSEFQIAAAKKKAALELVYLPQTDRISNNWFGAVRLNLLTRMWLLRGETSKAPPVQKLPVNLPALSHTAGRIIASCCRGRNMIRQQLGLKCSCSSIYSAPYYTCVYSIWANGLLLLGKTFAACNPQRPIRAQRCLGNAGLNVPICSGKGSLQGTFFFL